MILRIFVKTMRLTKISISRPVSITMLFIGIVFLGLLSFNKLGIDLLPNVKLPHLLVQICYPNSNPELIEQLIKLDIKAMLQLKFLIILLLK
jgi:multidrug efflux pump subunit AcrB